jgi:tetratricopeptide (TPR) repeat protein
MTQRIGPDRSLARVRRAISRGEYRLALDEVDRLLARHPDQPHLLITRAELIQLQEDEEGIPPLEAAKEDLQKAVALDENSPAALIELGHYLYSVEDNADLASRCFRKAISLGRSLLEEALIGQAEVFHEQGQDAEALACIAEAHSLRKRDKEGDRKFFERLRSVLQSG